MILSSLQLLLLFVFLDLIFRIFCKHSVSLFGACCPYLAIFCARIMIIAVTCVSLKLFERFSAVRCSFARTWGCGLVKSQNKSVRCFYVRALLFLLLFGSALLCSLRFTCLIDFGIFGTILKLRDFDMNCGSLKKIWRTPKK